ncbi:MAG: hypothetical protein ACK4R6_10365 [Spirosomataceae bacterium]
MKKTFLLSVVVMAVAFKTIAQTAKTLSAQEQTIILARQLADYGYANKDALSLANAAKMIASNTKKMEMQVSEKTEDAGGKKESNTQTVASKSSVAKTSRTTVNTDELIRNAKALADGNATLLSAIGDIERSMVATKGLTSGSVTKYYRIESNSTKTLYGTYQGGEQARLTVSGDGDTDLDLYIYDELDNLIDSDYDGTDYCITTWTPKWTGKFKIVIKNRGDVYNDCVLISN